ncbi:MAG: hypothetical protein KAS66_07565 [Candidatus Omnitrophica bacterium]|nr:hypothetical protein [Candidatus Omnitrophota bacterium]
MAYKIVYIYSRRAVKFPYNYSDSHNATDGMGLQYGVFVIPADARMDGIKDV